MKTKWVLYDGYHRTLHLVEQKTGQIVGEVYGSEFDPKAGWSARVYGGFDDPNGEHLGCYVSEKDAKAAVEGKLAAKRECSLRKLQDLGIFLDESWK